MDVKLASVIITTRNRKNIVLDCLNSVLRMNYTNLEVILMDNASSDGTTEAVKKKFPRVKIVVSKKNLGIAGGRNAGLKVAKGGYILFLDSDTVVDINMATELINLIAKDAKIGIVVPKIYFFDEPNRIWYAGAKVNLFTSRTKNIGVYELDQGQYEQVYEVSHGPTAFLCRKEVIERIGDHEEKYFMSYADLDFAIRAKKNGFRVLFAPKAKLWHRIATGQDRNSIRDLLGTFPPRAYYFARNRFIFMKRHAKKLNFMIFLILFTPGLFLYYTTKIILCREWKYLRMYLLGLVDGLRYVLTNNIYDLDKKVKSSF